MDGFVFKNLLEKVCSSYINFKAEVALCMPKGLGDAWRLAFSFLGILPIRI